MTKTNNKLSVAGLDLPSRPMSARKKNQRIRLSDDGMVYSTQPQWKPDTDHDATFSEEMSPSSQTLYVSLDRKQRAGKPVTLVEGFQGSGMELLVLGKELKAICGAGGSVKDGAIIIQGDHRDRVISELEGKGFKTKRKGG